MIITSQHCLPALSLQLFTKYSQSHLSPLIIIPTLSKTFKFTLCPNITALLYASISWQAFVSHIRPYQSLFITVPSLYPFIKYITTFPFISHPFTSTLYSIAFHVTVSQVFINISSKRQSLPAMSTARRLHYEGIIYRFKVLMLATLLCAAMTVIGFILGQVMTIIQSVMCHSGNESVTYSGTSKIIHLITSTASHWSQLESFCSQPSSRAIIFIW